MGRGSNPWSAANFSKSTPLVPTLLIAADICPIDGNLPWFKAGDALRLLNDLLPEFEAADLVTASLGALCENHVGTASRARVERGGRTIAHRPGAPHPTRHAERAVTLKPPFDTMKL